MAKIELDIAGMGELKELFRRAEIQMRELSDTMRRMEHVELELQAKINQPTAGTEG